MKCSSFFRLKISYQENNFNLREEPHKESQQKLRTEDTRGSNTEVCIPNGIHTEMNMFVLSLVRSDEGIEYCVSTTVASCGYTKPNWFLYGWEITT